MKTVPIWLSFLVVLCLFLALPSPSHAAPTAPEGAPTTCSHTSNEIAGRIVLDMDHDNWPDEHEGIAGITVYLANIHSGTTILQSTTTDSEGCYRLTRGLVVSGQWHRIGWSGMHPSATLIHDPDNGTTPGTPNYVFIGGAHNPEETDVVYRPGSTQPHITRCPFGAGTADIGGMVALDLDGDHRADAGEGIAGAIVTLAVSTPSQVVGEAVTDSNGCYRIIRSEPPVSQGSSDDIQGCCNHFGDGDGTPVDIQGCCNHRNPELTTYMYVRVTLPQGRSELLASYDPNGRQTPGVFYEVFTQGNGTFESDFLYRDSTPTAVSLSSFNLPTPSAPPASAWFLFGGSGITLTTAVALLLRRRTPLS